MKRVLLFLQAETRLHVGSGSDLGPIDLPIQREALTGYPYIRGESLKGALRAAFEKKGKAWANLFESHKITVEFDAQLIAFPAPTLIDTFAFVSCPGLIKRLRKKLLLLDQPQDLPCPENTSGAQGVSGETFVIHDYMTGIKYDESTQTTAKKLREMALRSDPIFGGDFFEKHFIVIRDEDFRHLVESGTDVTTRNKIGDDGTTNTETGGNLFIEENIPEETILCAMLGYDETGSKDQEPNARDLINALNDEMFILSIGGSKNAAHGLCWTKTYPTKTEEING